MRLLSVLSFVLLGLGPCALAQEAVAVSQPGVTMTALGGPVSDATTSLLWRGNWFVRTKVAVETWTFDQEYALTVEARNPRLGRSAGVVNLVSGAPARDLVRDIDRGLIWLFTTGDATLNYVATAPAGAPGGSETHVVTYTITQQ